jgi:hypothetical protein
MIKSRRFYVNLCKSLPKPIADLMNTRQKVPKMTAVVAAWGGRCDEKKAKN